MSWSKVKQQLEGFLSPTLQGRVEYRATSYRYLPDKAGQCYLTVDKVNVLNMRDATTGITWYQTELEIKQDPHLHIPISEEEMQAVRKETKGAVPDERMKVMIRNRKATQQAKVLLASQAALSKSSFVTTANQFLTRSIDSSLESEDILLNILALIDRRVGKKRIIGMKELIKSKHAAVQYFYALRLERS